MANEVLRIEDIFTLDFENGKYEIKERFDEFNYLFKENTIKLTITPMKLYLDKIGEEKYRYDYRTIVLNSQNHFDECFNSENGICKWDWYLNENNKVIGERITGHELDYVILSIEFIPIKGGYKYVLSYNEFANKYSRVMDDYKIIVSMPNDYLERWIRKCLCDKSGVYGDILNCYDLKNGFIVNSFFEFTELEKLRPCHYKKSKFVIHKMVHKSFNI